MLSESSGGLTDGQAASPENTWLFSEREFLKASPSRKQLTLPQDLKTRESIHDFVIRLGTALRVDGRTILATTIYINRFYVRMPITTSKYFVACAAMSISCKLNDTYRAPDKIAMAGCALKNPNKTIDEQSSIFWHWRDQLLFREELILKNLNFELNLELPYELRASLEELPHSDDHEVFYEKLPDIAKNAISLVEILSALPITVTYDMPTILATAVVLTVNEAELRFTNLTFPAGFLQNSLAIDFDWCYQCYLYILRLLDYCTSDDPKLASNRNVQKKLEHISALLQTAFQKSEAYDKDTEVLIALFGEKRYSTVVQLCCLSTTELTGFVRILYLQSLIYLGDYDNGLRELCVAISAEYSSFLRYNLCLFLTVLLANMKKMDHAKTCLQEVVFELELELHVREPSDPYYVQLQGLLEKCGRLNLESPSLEPQLWKPMLTISQQLVLESCNFLLRRGLHRPRKQEIEYALDVIFESVVSLERAEVFVSLAENFAGMVLVVNREFKAIFNTDILSFQVEEWANGETGVLNSFEQASVIVKHLIVCAHFQILAQRYHDAISVSNKALEVLRLLKTSRLHTECNNNFCRSTAHLLLVESHELGNVVLSSEAAFAILLELTEEPIDPIAEFARGRLTRLSLGYAHLYEVLAHENGLPSTDRRQLVFEMLRKLVLAVTTENTAPVEIYEWILWGILWHGNLHRRVFWFFYLARGIAASSAASKNNVRYERLRFYVNGWTLAEELYRSYNQKWGWAEDPRCFLPCFHAKDDLLVLCGGPREFDAMAASRELVDEFVHSYRQYRGRVPRELAG